MEIGRIDVNKLRGVADKAFGLAKEFAGVVAGSESWEREGEAQQERATAELKALRSEIRAQKKDAKAEVLEQRQRAAQRAKENADR